MTVTTIPVDPATSRWGLPGVPVPGDLVATRPDQLLAPGTLLLAGVAPGARRGWADHLRQHGPLPRLDATALAAAAEAADLRGFGGAAFPTAVKLRGAAAGRPPLVVVNGAEGEEASAKDGVLLRHVPHLVLDGALLAARALGTDRVTVRLAADRPDLPALLRAACAERGDGARVTVSVGPATFAAGEATAVVNGVLGRPPLPTDLGRPPRTPGTLGALRRPALVSNVETYARLALLARGLPADSALLTVSGAVARRGVLELDRAATIADAVRHAGGPSEPVSAVVTGGWHGRWLPWSGQVRGAALSREGLDRVGGRWGAGVFVLLAADLCPLLAVSAVAATLAEGTAGQCGPCHAGLPRVAAGVAALRRPTATDPVPELRTAMAALRGRGLCAHPTAAVDALASALDLVADDVAAHARGTCTVLDRRR